MLVLAIDAGPVSSGVVVVADISRSPVPEVLIAVKDYDNERLVRDMSAGWVSAGEDLDEENWVWCHDIGMMLYEKVASYGMAVGASIFDTVFWCGRFVQAWGSERPWGGIERKTVKHTLCGSMKAKDANIRQRILDIYESHPDKGGGKIPQVGTKSQQGPLYGVSSHAWSALAVALTYHELNK